MSCLFLFPGCKNEDQAPEAHIKVKPQIGKPGMLIDLDASESLDPDGIPQLMQYRWDFENDGIWDTKFGRYQVISHAYATTGSFKAMVETLDPQNLSDTASVIILIRESDTMTDPRDGRTYPVVHLGNLWWMAQNLDYGVLVEPGIDQKNNSLVEKYRYPGDDPDSLFGGLYQWNEAMDYYPYAGSRGICPPGWRIPTEADWADLMSQFTDSRMPRYASYILSNCKFVPDQVVTQSNYYSTGSAVKLLKSTGSSGFDAVTVGYRDPEGNFGYQDYHFPGLTASFWTSSSDGAFAVRNRLWFNSDNTGEVFYFADNKNFGFSVRCVKNAN
jgi:uncharacterized protein (TIGR02145 family)